MKKKNMAGFCACLAAAVLMAGGCGQSGKTVDTTVSQTAEKASETTGEEKEESPEASETEEAPETTGGTVNDIYSEIEGAVSLYSPVIMPDSFISNYYGIDVSALDEYVFAMSEEATSAETIVIMKVKSEDSLDAVKTALQTVIDEKKAEMENYLPEQFEIVKNSSVQVKGNYVYLVISEQAGTISEMIEAGIQ